MIKKLTIILLILFLAACEKEEGAQNDNTPTDAVAQATQATDSTPTLAPGVPSETPQTAETPLETAVPTMTPTPSLTPTPTPEPVERFPRGQMYFFHEDYETAAHEFQIALSAGVLDGLQRQEALLKMGQSYYHVSQYQAAADAFNELLAQTSLGPTPTPTVEAAEIEGETAETAVSQTAVVSDNPGQPKPSDAYYWLALSLQAMGDCPAAIGAYEAYLTLNADMSAYVQPSIGDCYLAIGDRIAAYAAYETAAEGRAPNLWLLNLHHRLADMYLEDENYEATIAEYNNILNFAVTEGTRGQTHYLIGTTALTAGNAEAANENLLIAVMEYPQAYESYLSLVQLVEAGVEVDFFQRGLVDYYADVYDPAITAFNGYIAANPVHREDVHLYLAWSYEQLGNVTAALAEIDAYIEAFEPPPAAGEEPAGGDLTAVANGILEKGKLQARSGLTAEAIASYRLYLERFPAGADAPFAAWQAAALTERLGDIPSAIAAYQAMAAGFPEHQDADEALFHAGLLYRDQGNTAEATNLWRQTAELYPDQMYGAASLLWLLKTLPAEEAEAYRQRAAELNGDSYFVLRVVQEAQGIPPFTPVENLNLDIDMTAEQAATEEWLRSWLQLDPSVNLRELPASLASDPDLIQGEKLWRIGLKEQARARLETVRQRNADDVLANYHMALFLRDIGLYRSSIAAAESVMRQARVNGLGAPLFLARLAYPIYYSDLVVAEAQKYGYDPLLQFSLIRQESLYESFALSTAVAQGLSQVIPDTGAYIATQLDWPNYENDDLYRPYVGIAFGAFYLDQQLDAFDGFVPAALSAYNAGPGNAARWYGEAPGDIDRYHEVVNFTETRHYIERIYVGHVIYKYLYGG